MAHKKDKFDQGKQCTRILAVSLQWLDYEIISEPLMVLFCSSDMRSFCRKKLTKLKKVVNYKIDISAKSTFSKTPQNKTLFSY